MTERKKRILIFAHYYAPDTASTGQILRDLAEGLREEFEVTVICAVPSYDGKVSHKMIQCQGIYLTSLVTQVQSLGLT